MLEWMKADFAGRGIDAPRLDAELLVAHALGSERIQLYLDLDRPLADQELSDVKALVKRRRAFEPMAYILGYRDFYKLRFEVNAHVLIPRPDTESLVEVALPHCTGDARVIDLCTGSGCVAISLAAERPLTSISATDISPEALAVAERNAQTHGVAVEFACGDLFAGFEGPFDLVVSNPPYIRNDERDELSADVRDHEPGLALFAGDLGTEVHTRIVNACQTQLRAGGVLAMELGAEQAAEVRRIFADAGYVDVQTKVDLGGIERVVSGTWPGAS